MALANYTDLKASVANWMNRDDLTAVIPDFIALFESTANTEGAIRTQFNRTSTTISTVANQNYISTPSDFLGADSLILTNNGGGYSVLKPYGGAAALYTDYPSAALSAATPKGFFNLAGKLELAPVPDAVYSLNLYYYQRIPALASNATNWLLTNFPQIYLFGSLIAAEAFLGSDPRIQLWGDFYNNAVQKLGGSTDRDKFGGAALSVKADVVV